MWINTILLGNYPSSFPSNWNFCKLKGVGLLLSHIIFEEYLTTSEIYGEIMDSLISNTAAINGLLARFGVKFGIYKNGEFMSSCFPTIRFLELFLRMSSLKLKPAWFSVSMRSTPSWETSTRKSELSLTAWFRKTSLFRQAASCRRVTTLFHRTEFTLIFQALTSSKLKTELGTFLKTTYAFLQALPIL